MHGIALTDVLFRWPGQDCHCLDIPELSIAAGESVFLFGPSGSGKSSLLSLIGGVTSPERGRISVLGTDLARLSARQRDAFRADHIGFVFQQFNLLPWLSALDNVLLPLSFSPERKRRAGDGSAEAERLLDRLDLARELWHKPAGLMSVGQQQRIAVARALLGHPEIVIADEPTSGLDAARQASFLELLRSQTDVAGASLLFVSHDERLASRFDRKIALDAINRARPEDTP
ncbi:MAG: ATP-binding cassette domain-containing protein [Propionivibrio sp.]